VTIGIKLLLPLAKSLKLQMKSQLSVAKMNLVNMQLELHHYHLITVIFHIKI